MENTALYGFQTVLDVRHSTVQNTVTGIIEKPVLVHTAEVVYCRSVEAAHGFIVGVPFYGTLRLLLFQNLVVFYFVIHMLMGL